jgi:hypothetical protein
MKKFWNSSRARFVFKKSSKRVIASDLRERSNLVFRIRSPRLAYGGLAMTVLFLWMGPVLFAAESVMKTLSAHVAKVSEDGLSIDVDFHHPATKEIQRLTFYVDGQTGLSGLEKLQELHAGQVVSIDYVEGERHRLLIRRIARVKLSGPPAGLERFRGL